MTILQYFTLYAIGTFLLWKFSFYLMDTSFSKELKSKQLYVQVLAVIIVSWVFWPKAVYNIGKSFIIRIRAILKGSDE